MPRLVRRPLARTFLRAVAPLAISVAVSITQLPAPAWGNPSLSQNEKAVVTFFDTIRHSPPMLRAFLGRMPKGADLNIHLTGATYAEDYLRWAAEEGLCVDNNTAAILAPAGQRCPTGSVSAVVVADNATAYQSAVASLSLPEVYASPAQRQHSALAIDKAVSAISLRHQPAMLATLMQRAASQGIVYLEVMVPLYPASLPETVRRVGWNDDPAATLHALREAGLFSEVDKFASRAEEWIREARQMSGSPVDIRLIIPVTRNAPPENVLAQLAFSAEVTRRSPHVVGMALTGPETAPLSLRDYNLHMRLLSALLSLPEYADIPVALHAGERTIGQVVPQELRFPIRRAVDTGHTRRVGHGTSISYEDNPFTLLHTMREKRIAVEIYLTSDAQMLQVDGSEHPFAVYRRYGVPVVISTGAEGILRTDLTNEYLRAARDYQLGYADLKALSRNSLEYSFLPGESLWADSATFLLGEACKDSPVNHETASCARLLRESEKAALQWQLEKAFTDFERDMARTAPSSSERP